MLGIGGNHTDFQKVKVGRVDTGVKMAWDSRAKRSFPQEGLGRFDLHINDMISVSVYISA